MDMHQKTALLESLKLPRKAYEHQAEEWVLSEPMQNRLLLWDMGTGKTLTAVVWLRLKYRRRQGCGPTLILAPLATLSGWLREFKANAPANVFDGVVIAAGQGKKKLSGAKRAELILKDTSKIVVTNHDCLNLSPALEAMKKKGFKDIVVDEIHRFKDPRSQRFKNLLSFSDRAENRLGLTGTVILKNYMDVWGPFRIVDKGRLFGTNFYSHFRNKYFVDRNAGGFGGNYPDWQPKKGIENEISNMMAVVASVKRKEECLSLPPRVVMRIDVPLSAEQERLYEEMRDELVAEAEGGDATATNALVKLLRLRQILCGFIQLERDAETGAPGDVVTLEENPRLEALAEILPDILAETKVVIWSTFRANYPKLRKMVDSVLGYEGGWAELTGDTKDREGELRRFQEDPKCRVFLSNPKAGGTGVDGLQHVSSCCIYFDRDHNAGDYWQSRDRIHRGGSEKHASIREIHLVTPDTVDEDILEALERKENFAENILQRVRSMNANRSLSRPRNPRG